MIIWVKFYRSGALNIQIKKTLALSCNNEITISDLFDLFDSLFIWKTLGKFKKVT